MTSCFLTVSLYLFRHCVELMLRFNPSCDKSQPVETEFDGADQGIYSVKLSYLLINFNPNYPGVGGVQLSFPVGKSSWTSDQSVNSSLSVAVKLALHSKTCV